VSHIFDREPVIYFPDTGAMHRMNPIPERAKESRLRVLGNLAQTGFERLDWREVERVTTSQIREFLDAFRITGDLPGTILAGNYKTNKPRVDSGRLGKIAGLNLMPHYYPNILNLPQMDPLQWNFQEIEDEEDAEAIEEGDRASASPELKSVRKRKEEIRRLFNSFNGQQPATAAESSGLPSAKNLLNFCAGSSPYCRGTCLILTGNHTSAFETSQKKLKLTNAFLSDPVLFVAAVNSALKIFACACEGIDVDPVVRLNMLSDIPWYSLCPELFETHKEIAFYDYTKLKFWKSEDYQRIAKGVDNLDLTFSYSGSNAKDCEEALKAGYRVAAVFASADPKRVGTSGGASRTTFKEIVSTSGLVDADGYMSLFGGKWLAIDGDESDYRIDDPPQSIVCLNFKAPNVKLKWEAKDQKKLDALLNKQAQGPLTTKEGNSLENLLRQKEDVEAYSALAEYLPEARQKFSVMARKTSRGQEISRTVNNKRLWRHARETNKAITPSAFSPDQLFELSQLAFPENVQQALAWFADMESAEAAKKAGIAMQYVSPTEDGARANGPGLLIGPHVPVIVND
jgi:hypothetical protein